MAKKKAYKRKDHLYHKAKEEGLRSRAVYKLEELQKRFQLIKKGCNVLDLGAWPGGWLELSSKLAGAQAKVVGIDLTEIEDIAGCQTIVGDVGDEDVIQQALALSEGHFDVVLSDMSPKLTGIKDVDEAACSVCYEIALDAANRALKAGGSLVIKAFKGNESSSFFKVLKQQFKEIKRCELDSTRKSSNEFYFVCLKFQPQ